jgi:hypothetical protein
MNLDVARHCEERKRPAGSADALKRTNAALSDLLKASLALWRVDGTVNAQSDGSLVATIGERRLVIARADTGPPIRWMIAVDGRTRGAVSVAGVLRIVGVAAGRPASQSRLRIAPQGNAPLE